MFEGHSPDDQPLNERKKYIRFFLKYVNKNQSSLDYSAQCSLNTIQLYSTSLPAELWIPPTKDITTRLNEAESLSVQGERLL